MRAKKTKTTIKIAPDLEERKKVIELYRSLRRVKNRRTALYNRIHLSAARARVPFNLLKASIKRMAAAEGIPTINPKSFATMKRVESILLLFDVISMLDSSADMVEFQQAVEKHCSTQNTNKDNK